MPRRTLVFGPAYLDRVLRVDRPLLDLRDGPPIDQSVDGHLEFGPGLTLVDPGGATIEVTLPGDWPGPTGSIILSQRLSGGEGGWHRTVIGEAWRDDLGGMGAGFAAALGGELVSALGPDDDPTSRVVADLLAARGVTHRPIRVADREADWTLLVTSAGHGDKLPVGFRGCHSAIDSFAPFSERSCDLRVVAALPNRLAEGVLRAPGAAVRFFAPAMRNVLDRDCPIGRFAGTIDVLSCNRREWESLPDREEVAWRVSILAITDGPLGSLVRFTTPSGEPGIVRVSAFARSCPPRDTNRAGEAYAATLLTTLLDAGWQGGPADESLVRLAAERASVAAALVLDRLDFGFPEPARIDAALRLGRVDPESDGGNDDVR